MLTIQHTKDALDQIAISWLRAAIKLQLEAAVVIDTRDDEETMLELYGYTKEDLEEALCMLRSALPLTCEM